MNNIGLIIAGGVGARMNQDIPKQFISVMDKPVIVYTMEAFQNSPEITSIFVVCLKGWETVLSAYAKQFNITKLEGIIPGGSNGQESIRNGLLGIAERYSSDDDIVLIHDAIRPMVSEKVLSDNIRVCREHGNAVTAVPCTAAMLLTEDSVVSEAQIARDKLKITQTPQTFFLNEILDVHKKALEKGITNSVASCTLYVEMGRKLYLSPGSEENIKLTTQEDLEIFKSLLASKRKK